MHRRAYVVDRAGAGRPLAEWLRLLCALDRPAAVRLIRGRRVLVGGVPCLDPQRRMRRGERVVVFPQPATGKQRDKPPIAKNPAVPRYEGPAPVVRFADDHIVVVDKPAGLTTMRHTEEAQEHGRRAQRFLPPTLQDLLPGLLSQSKRIKTSAVRAVHRLDKETSGLVVFARTREAEGHLGKQFRAHTTERLYRAIVRGEAKDARIESRLVGDRGDGRRGSTADAGAQRAVTRVRVIENLGDYTLVECRLETGRTHQVRIHLGEAGTPLCGERVYDRPLNGRPLRDGSGAKRVMLHATVLGFEHPVSGERVSWKAKPPKDMEDLLHRLRREAKGDRSSSHP
jgi:23S rRNA pseudouridine1911/1915/1917 synthase